MKNPFFPMFLICFVLSTFAPDPFAAASPQWHLPEGVKTRLGKGSITGEIQYSPDGKTLAVGSSIGVWLYDAETGKELDLLAGHETYVKNVAFSPDGQTLMSADLNLDIRLWNTATSESQHLRSGCGGCNGMAIAFSPNGQILASGGRGVGWGEIRFRDVETGENLGTFDGYSPELESGLVLRVGTSTSPRTRGRYTGSVNSVSFHPDGRTLAGGCSDGTIRFWEVDTGEPLRTLKAHTSGVEIVAFHPNGRTLVSSGRLDGTIRLWNAATGDRLHTLTGHQGWINSLAFSPDGKTLASASRDGTIRLWNANTGKHIRTFKGHRGSVSRISFHPNGQTLASASEDETIRLWNANTGRYLRTLTRHTGWVSSVAFSPNGRRLASASRDETIRLWDTITREQLIILTGHTDAVNSVGFSPNGRRVVSGSSDGTIRLWNANTGKHQRTLKGHVGPVSSVGFSPNGRRLVSASLDGTIRLWNANTGKHQRTLKGHASEVNSVVFSPDGQTLASAGLDRIIRLWDAISGEQLRRFEGHTLPIKSIAFAPDGQTFASSSGGWGDKTRLWDADTGEELSVFKNEYGNSVVFSPDGQTLASGLGAYTLIRIWDTATGEELHALGKQVLMNWDQSHSVNSVSFHPDGQTLASGSQNGTVLLWDLAPSPPEQEKTPADVNADGTVNVQDLVWVAANFGKTGQHTADVNADGVVNIIDLTHVAGAMNTVSAAPSAWSRDPASMPPPAQVETWLDHARQMDSKDPLFQRGLLMLEQLLGILMPKETALLPNYPNPFNPETWIPYRLAEPGNVSIAIYTADGQLVRRFSLGDQPAGAYESRSRAVYWDGRNTLGEPVASGMYFYTLIAGDFIATRKLLIRK